MPLAMTSYLLVLLKAEIAVKFDSLGIAIARLGQLSAQHFPDQIVN